MLDDLWEVIGFLAQGKRLPLDSSSGHRKARVMDAMGALVWRRAFTDPTNPEFKRACLNMVCTGSQEILSIGLHECVKAALSRPIARQPGTNENTCVLRNGSCKVSDNPYGVASRNSDMGETLLAQSTSRAVFSSVEYDHPVNRSGLQNFIATNVPSSHFIRGAVQVVWYALVWLCGRSGRAKSAVPDKPTKGISRPLKMRPSLQRLTRLCAIRRLAFLIIILQLFIASYSVVKINRATCLRFDRDERRGINRDSKNCLRIIRLLLCP